MKILHWTLINNSGLHHVARDMSEAEKAQGIDSAIIDTMNPENLKLDVTADVHVIHSHIPDHIKETKPNIVYIAHGTPEHCFQNAVESGLNQGYGAGDAWMMLMHFMQIADVTVTWWPRHQKILQSLSDKNTRIEIVPLGVNTDVFKPQDTRGKWAGEPSVFTSENCHYIKWPLDLFILWPWVTEQIPNARLHAHYLPRDQHRWFMPLVYRNGTAYKTFLSGDPLQQPELINAFCSTDFYLNLVRYGDFDRMTMEAKACGAKVISYIGNEYADYWITEGDQRFMASQLIEILRGEVEPRDFKATPDISETVTAMVKIYESLTNSN